MVWRPICMNDEDGNPIVNGVATRIIGLCALAVAWGWPASGGEMLTGHVEPISGLAPRDVYIEAQMEPNADNRSVTFTVDSGAFYTSSTFPLAGDRAPRVKNVTFRMLPMGHYTVRISLAGASGERAYYARTIELY